jgi:hypothetical protein
MAAIILPTVWNRQPTGPLDIDQGNPLTEGIIFVSHGGVSGYDPITRTFPTTVNASVTQGGVGPSGKAEVFATSGYREYAHADSLIFANGYSVLSVARPTSLAAQSGLAAKWDTPSGVNVPMSFFVRASGELALWRNVAGTNNGTYGTTTTDGGTTGTSVISTNRDFVASVDMGSTAHNAANLYVDGYRRFSGWTFGPSGSDVALSEPAGSKFGVGVSNGGANSWQGNIYLTICWNRRLTSKEHALLHANPWQIFQPTARRIFLNTVAGSGVTGTLARTNANDTSAASGTTTVLGTLAKTNANDTSAASGTTTVLGTLAKTNANDTSAASGTVGSGGSTGTVAYTNANDTVVASGKTTILGVLSKTNANDSVVAAGWAGRITGTLAKTNANDTVVANGNSGTATTSTSAPTEPNSIDWGALVAKTWGKDYVKPEWDYEFSNGRRFLEKKNPYA